MPLKIAPTADLGGKLSTLRTRITEREFNELCRLAAFLRRGRLSMEDLQHMAERPPRESEDPDFRGVVAERFGTADRRGDREVYLLHWARQFAAVLLADRGPSIDPVSGSVVWVVQLDDIKPLTEARAVAAALVGQE